MENVLNHDVGKIIRSAASHAPLDMPDCSPCFLKLSDEPAPGHDHPYDTARCDHHCVGKWEPALHRFAIYLLHKLNERLTHIEQALEQKHLQLPRPDDVEISLELHADGGEYNFRLQTMDNGHLRWHGAGVSIARLRVKDATLAATIMMGGRGTSPAPAGLRGRPHATPVSFTDVRLPSMQLKRYKRNLASNVFAYGGQVMVVYELPTCHVRLYSKHRRDRGDAPVTNAWRTYADPDTLQPWEYLSGPRGRRLVRRSPEQQPMDVDAEERSEDESEHDWAFDNNRTPTPSID